jgi:ribonucleotide monophosphatase NagD (HAD superfamily)
MPAVVVGKPERIIFDIARKALAGCARIGVIGDHLTTDIEGAKRAGLDAILMLTEAGWRVGGRPGQITIPLRIASPS